MEVTSLVAWTLLHFLWQGALIGLAAKIAFRALDAGRASTRYAIGVLALALMALMPAITAGRLGTRVTLPIAPDVAAEPLGPEILSSADATLRQQTSTALVASSKHAAGSPPRAALVSSPRESSPVPKSVLTRLRSWGDAAAPYVVRIWLAGVLLLSLRLLAGWLGVRKLMARGVQDPAEIVRERFALIAARIGASPAVRLVESALVSTPAAIGFLRPVVLWPVSLTTGLTVSQIDVLLAHELAHLKRYDYLVNLAQTVLETALFYHPAIWWLSKRVREERELCCDDLAADLTGDRREFAEALVALESWRQSLPVFATAATGGNLLARVQRMLAKEPATSSDRPRWTALPLAVAALAGMLISEQEAGARSARGENALDSVEQIEVSSDFKFNKERAKVTGPAQPASVTRFEGEAPLVRRVAWASEQAAKQGVQRYWIGYSIAAKPDGALFFMDRVIPVSAEGSVFMGHIRFKRGDHLSFPGVSLDAVIGPRSTEEAVIFIGFNAKGAVERVHAASGTLPAHFDGRALFWLDDASDAESLAFLKSAMEKTATEDLRGDLISVVGVHTDGEGVFQTLRGWVDSNASEHVRVNAVEEMGNADAKDAVAFLDRVAREDRSHDARREAAEALGEQPSPDATKALGLLVRALRDGDVAREAAESLGERHDPAAFDELVSIAWSDVAEDVRREAVESMGESGSPRAAAELKRIALTHPSEDVRREAIETIGETDDKEGAVDVIEKILSEDASDGARDEALDTLGEIHTDRAKKALAKLATSETRLELRKKSIESLLEQGDEKTAMTGIEAMLKSTDLRTARAAIELMGDVDSNATVATLKSLALNDARTDMQRAAVEALGDAAPVEQAFEALREIVRRNPNEKVQHQAVESMGNIQLPGVVQALEEIARTHASEQVRVAAVESLDRDDETGVTEVLERLAQDGNLERVQIAAMEAIASDHVSPEAVRWLADRAEQASSARVRLAALEALEDAGADGIDGVIRAARSTKDREIRRRAVEILAESSDPRAKKELARILEK